MRRYGIFQALIYAFGSPSLYRDVATHWRGTAYLLLLLLSLLAALDTALTINHQLDAFNQAFAPDYIRQLPTITIENGRARTPEAVPYLITDPVTNKPVIFIDTTREQIAADAPTARVYLSRTQIIYRQDARETRIYDLTTIDDLLITRDYAHQVVQALADWLAWVLLPFIWLGIFLLRLLLALTLALLGMIVAAIMRTRLQYDALVALAIVSSTPVVLVDVLLGLFSPVGIHWLLGVLINLALLVVAIQVSRTQFSTDSYS